MVTKKSRGKSAAELRAEKRPAAALDKSEIYSMVSFRHKEREGEKNANNFFYAYSGMVDAAKLIDPDIKTEWHGPHAWDPIPEAEAIQALTARKAAGHRERTQSVTVLDNRA